MLCKLQRIQLSNCLLRAEANPIYRGEVSRQKFEQIKDKARTIYSLYLMPMGLSAIKMKYLASGTMASRVLTDATKTYSSFGQYYQHDHLQSESKSSAGATTTNVQLQQQQQTHNCMLEVINAPHPRRALASPYLLQTVPSHHPACFKPGCPCD